MIGCGAYFLLIWPLRDPHPAVPAVHGALAIRDARVYVSPDAPPIEHGSVLVRDGAIVSVGPDVTVPPDAQVLPCGHCVVTAGFWNAHIHFTERKWSFAAWKSAATLNAQLADLVVLDGDPERGITASARVRFTVRNGRPVYGR